MLTPPPVSGPITISWSEIDSFRQCPFKWRLGYAERWVEPETSPALTKGILWHKVLEIHYNILANGGTLGECIERIQAYLNYDESGWAELVAWMYNGYIQYWQEEDRRLDFIQAETKLDLPLIPGLVNIKCRLDLLCRDWDGMLWMWDHKSCRNLPNKKETDLDDQFALYQWMINQSGQFGKIFGVIHSASRTFRTSTDAVQSLESRFTRIKMVRSDQELDTMIQEIQSTALDILSAYQNLDKLETMVTPRHPDPDRCKWRCGFTSPCLLGRTTTPERTREMLAELGFHQDYTRH
ncbi:MAG: hypothetical protein VM34scaffold347_10 [Phage 66_12]|jgi:hypothetical protein|nr:MAG: hypothetical protein VM34scaffold347_10 [Phage 66_12]